MRTKGEHESVVLEGLFSSGMAECEVEGGDRPRKGRGVPGQKQVRGLSGSLSTGELHFCLLHSWWKIKELNI